MTRFIAEVTLDRYGEGALGRSIPAGLVPIVRAFVDTTRDSLRFLWRDEERWLAVHLISVADTRRATPSTATDRVTARVAEVELPRRVSVREVDILTLLALGLANSGIAARLGTSARTVSTQIERLLVKLDQSSRGGLAALAVDAGMVRLPIPGGADGVPAIGIVELERAVHRQPVMHVQPLRPAYPRRGPLVVGALIPTAAAASDGAEVSEGALLAAEEINASGGIDGRRIELVSAEVDIFDRGSVQRGLEELFAAEVDAVTTNYANAGAAADLELLAGYDRPFLHTATFDEQVRYAESDATRYGSVLQFAPSETVYGLGMVRFLVELEQAGRLHPRRRRIVSVEADTPSTRITNALFVSSADRAGWAIDEVIRVPVCGADWAAVAARLVQLDPDVVMVAHFLSEPTAAFHQAFLATGLPALLYYVYGPSIPDFQQVLGPGADGAVWSTTTGTYDDVLGRRFRAQFSSRFGRPPGWSQAGAAYDQVRLLASAWSVTGSRDAKAVVRHLRSWPHRGVNGVYYFGDAGHATLSYPDTTADASMGQAQMIYQIQDGQHRPLGPEPFGSVSTYRTPTWRRSLEARSAR